ncbi:hypothetical protein F4680DRAFT_447166 [Xylaria scruposa]|nr:hypothetical protein F4680DRAFT_447166 [Xylaria scruposa]
MSSTNPYEVLGVDSDADVAAIQKAFRGLSLKHHPDKANASTTPRDGETKTERQAREQRNHERYVRVVEARDTLLDATKRRNYDEQARKKKKESTHEASKSSDPSKARKPEEARSQSTAQKTTANLRQAITTTLKRLELLGAKLRLELMIYHGLDPLTDDEDLGLLPIPCPERDEVILMTSRVIARITSISDRTREAGERLRSQENDSTARAACESTLQEASSYIQQVQELISGVDEVWTRRDANDPLELLYRDLLRAFPPSMRR